MHLNNIVLKLNKITKSFNGFKVVNRVSMTFSKGKINSIIGPNGAGKTTLFNLINGFLKLDNGEIHHNGRRIDGFAPWKIAKLGIGRIFQDVRVFNKLTALENVLLSNKDQPGENPLICLFLRRNALKKERVNIENARRWLEFAGLSDKETTLAENLSYGQQKLLSIARLLAGEYDILLLDEPTAGVHPAMAKTILGVIKKMAEEGKTAVVIEHDMRIIAEISDLIYFIHEGRVTFSGTPEEVLKNHKVREAYIGI